DADVATDALLEAVLDGLLPAPRERPGREVLDALHRAELGTLAARPAEVDVHERHLARPLLLLADIVRDVGDPVLLQAPADDIDGGGHGAILAGAAAARKVRRPRPIPCSLRSAAPAGIL